jgi:hypothetical protein
MELIFTQTETNIKVSGTMTFKTELELIIMQMEIYIKVNGIMVNNMDKEITYIKMEKLFIKEIGKKEKNKDLDN